MPVAVVTGAAGGIGQAVCTLLTAEGYTVIGVDRCATPAGCRCAYTLQCDIKELHRWAVEPSDATSAQQLKALLASIAGAGAAPAVHLLVCNAAVQRLGALSELTVADFEETLATNLTAPAMLTQLLLPELMAAHGAVVNVSSIHANLTKPGFAAYAASKGGLVTLTKALAVELGPLGIRVNAVLPAATNTPMLQAGFAGNPAGMASLARLHPLGRICEPEEIAQFVVFLADSTKSGFINGSALQIDGGIGARLLDPDCISEAITDAPSEAC